MITRFLYIIAMLLFFSTGLIAQTKADTITIVQHRHSYTYKTAAGRELNAQQLKDTLRPNGYATALLQKASRTDLAAFLLAGAGAAGIGYGIEQAITGSKLPWAPIVLGAGLLALNIPVTHSAQKTEAKAVGIYNNWLRKSAFKGFRPQYYLSFTGTQAGLLIRF